jgi:hypothetical protein
VDIVLAYMDVDIVFACVDVVVYVNVNIVVHVIVNLDVYIVVYMNVNMVILQYQFSVLHFFLFQYVRSAPLVC